MFSYSVKNPSPPSNLENNQTKILIVEDEWRAAYLLQRKLDKLGYQVVDILGSGDDIVKKVAMLDVDIILMDITLSGEQDGIEAARALIQSCDVPIIFLTGHADSLTIERAKSVEPVGYLVKPFKTLGLNSMIQVGLKRHQAQQDLIAQKSWLNTILQSIGDGVIVTDQHGDIRFMNPMAERLTGWKQTEALGISIEHVVQCFHKTTNAEDKIKNPVMQALEERQAVTLPENTLLLTHYDQPLPIDDSATPIVDENGEISGAVIVFRDVSERIAYQKKLFQRAFYDPLTNLPNRDLLVDRLETSMNRLQRYTSDQYALLFIDLDRFKAVNDSFGHIAGDHLLKAVSHRLMECLRPSDTVARLGGDEFAALLEHVENVDAVCAISQRIIDDLSRPFSYKEHIFHISCSIGIVLGKAEYQSAKDVIRDADIAMYRSKNRRRGTYTVFSGEMQSAAVERIKLENDFREALKDNQLELHCQPIWDVKSKQINGFESLVRWNHPTLT